MYRKISKHLIAFLALLLCACINVSAGNTVTIPTSPGSYINWNDADIEGCKIENDGANVGSTGKSTVVTFTIKNDIEQDYILTFAIGSKAEAKMDVTLANGSNTVMKKSVDIENTGNWTPTSQKNFVIPQLAKGEYTLTFAVTEASGYAGNWGKLAFLSTESYDKAPGSITLNNGSYSGDIRTENNGGNVGWITDGSKASYSFINTKQGVYNLVMDIARYGIGCLINITVTDEETGVEEVKTKYRVSESAPGDYTKTTIALPGEMSVGMKTLTMSFSEGSGFMCNYQNVNFEYFAPHEAKVASVAIDGLEIKAGDTTDWLCNLPMNYSNAKTTFSVKTAYATVAVTAKDDNGNNVAVTDNGNGTYTIDTPDLNKGVDVTMAITPNTAEGAVASKDAYTFRIFRIGTIEIKEIKVDGEVIDVNETINKAPYTAEFMTNIYTTMPVVSAKLIDGTVITASAPEVSGSNATYTFDCAMDKETRTFKLTVGGIHIYNKGEKDETVQIKYIGSLNNGSGVWTDGLYTLTTSGLDGWDNSSFKLNGSDYVWSIPTDVKVKQIIFKEFSANYGPGNLTAISAGDATVYKPTKSNYSNGSKYDLIINVENHKAGTPINFSLQGGGQPTAWFEFTIEKVSVTSAPKVVSQNVTSTENKNHCVVSIGFDREMTDTEATIDGKTIKAEGGSSVLNFSVWDLKYNSDNTFTIAAGNAKDTYGNGNAEAINIAIKVGSKAKAEKKAYDFVVSTAEEFKAALAQVNNSNSNVSAPRKTIFIKNGDYDFGAAEQRITGYNVSLIGESRDGVMLHGLRDGISNPVLNLRDRSGFYLQDLTVRNDYDYGASELKGVAVAIYGGNKTIMKNVRMLSNQDTQVTGERAYFEECEIHGTVDFICGGGDNFYWKTALVLENRENNCVTAPATNAAQKWGYVFQECTISKMDGADKVADRSYRLGRPWQGEPRCYFLNTTMEVLPGDNGWGGMSTLPTHFYEYNSMDKNGNVLDLSKRGNSDTSTNSYSPILSDSDAARFTVQNVLGGTDSWLPTEECMTIDAPVAKIEGSTLKWDDNDDARCFVIFRDGKYIANVTNNSYSVTEGGTYTVCAANVNGGLGKASAGVVFNATGITQIESDNAAGSNAMYNLNGQRVDTMHKGHVYIVNGKKVIK